MNYNELCLLALKASVLAGNEILKLYNTDFSIEYKSDKSPLTSADQASHDTIMGMLKPTGIPILSEEGKHVPYEIRSHWDLFWLVDPLDGTKEFINRNGEFTVNIALINKGYPVMGVVYVPVTGVLYFGSEEHGTYRYMIESEFFNHVIELRHFLNRSEKLPVKHQRDVTIMGSRSHNTPENSELINSISRHFEKVNLVNAGSSLKFCRLAEGAADIYPRLGPTMEWDTAAGHAVAKYANIRVLKYKSLDELVYNKAELVNPWFIATHPDFVSYLQQPG